MKKEKHIISYTGKEIEEMTARGKSQTDWRRIHLMTEEEIEENANADLDSPEYPYPNDFWENAKLVSPQKQIKPEESGVSAAIPSPNEK